MDEIPNYGLIHYQGFFNCNNILLTNPQVLSEVLVKRPYNFEKPAGEHAFMQCILRYGLVTLEGDVHKFQCRWLLPMFNFKNIKVLYPTFWKKATQLVEEIDKDVVQNPDSNHTTDMNA